MTNDQVSDGMGDAVPARATDASHSSPAASTGGGIPIALEFRPDADGAFDEIVARFADGMVHVETLSDAACYVGFYWDDGRYCQWYIHAERGKRLSYHHENGISDPPRFDAWGRPNARGIEARSVATAGCDPQDESPVRKDAPEHRQGGKHR